jgi:hypothetical protein
VIAKADADRRAGGPGFIGRIPLRNIWLLMFYTSDLLRTAERALVDAERNPDAIPKLQGRGRAARPFGFALTDRRIRAAIPRALAQRLLDELRPSGANAAGVL